MYKKIDFDYNKPMILLNDYYKNKFGEKIYKLSLRAKVTCPNRDGTIGTKGCIFCSQGGSGEFAQDHQENITEQIEKAKIQVQKKFKGRKYIAYFQNFSNTYAPISYLEEIFTEAINHPEIVGISIATRPDCLPEETLDLLNRLNQIKPVYIELGLQTVHEKTATYIRRGYSLLVFNQAVKELQKRNIEIVVHVILGLPGETTIDMVDTVRYISSLGVKGIKFHMLHILKDTDLEKEYRKGKISVYSLEGYLKDLKACVGVLPRDMVVHRFTGDGPKNLLVAPIWSQDKKKVLNAIRKDIINLIL